MAPHILSTTLQLLCLSLPLLTLATPPSYPPPPSPYCPSLDCSGTLPNKTAPPSRNPNVCRDARLGPVHLPRRLPLSGLLSSYDRYGGLTPGEFLDKWTDGKGSTGGSFVYPPQNGFVIDGSGKAINGSMVLGVGTLVDRFGSEYGSFVSAAEAPYSQRALPPANLATNPDAPDYPFNYHLYRVTKELTVVGGPIAPWFGQPGLGAQFFTGGTGNIMTLMKNGYLETVDPSVLETFGADNACYD